MDKYSFLGSLKLIDTGRIRAPKTNNPEGLLIRIFADGIVYPSQELVDRFDLNYKNSSDTTDGNGFDIVDTQYWKPLQAYPRMIMFGVTPKKEGKVDLFATTRYNEDGTPKGDVMKQGSASETLLNLVKELGWLTEEQTYANLRIVTEHPFKTEDGIAYIPKIIERGGKKGEKDYKRRDNVTFYPVELIEVATSTITTIEQTTVTI